ncbi:MAG: beta-L-arabinofuranosidase domain-containing protein [Planctomycetota bacterium]
MRIPATGIEICALFACSLFLPFASGAQGGAEVRVVPKVVAERRGGIYVGNREPLLPSPLLKLPIGAVVPKGWLRHMLELERDGMVGRLGEISPWLRFETSAWASPEGKGERGWEELPYWLKGFGDLGYVLGDERCIAEARKWIEAAMASRREDGYFGPRALETGLGGKPDLWPHMVMLNVLQSYYEFTGDRRAIEVMTAYLRWENRLPPSAFGEGYWPKIRAGDNIESAHWLYNRTGEPWLLDLARKIHENMARWDQDVINWHNVNIAQGFRAPAVYYVQSADPAHLEAAERNYRKVMDLYGQFPGGGFVGDENCRPGYVDPRGGIETCGIVEFLHSFEMLTKISGDPVWADRCEEIAFNSFPAALTPDAKGLHYITCANQVQLDRHNKAPGIQNSGTMFSYSPFEVYRCCQHNVSHGWPYYAEELWLATWDGGLCASLYAASEVRANVGDGTEVRIEEGTDYPFSETISFRVSAPRPVAFPLYLRIPSWCERPSAALNGSALAVPEGARGYLVVSREWASGDELRLRLPMKLAVRTWEKNKGCASVLYGPLAFSLKIEERWEAYGAHPKWREWEVFPASDWNYGLVLDLADPAKGLAVERRIGEVPPQPWTPDAAPIRVRAKARKIPNWKQDRTGLVGALQKSPAKTEEPIQGVILIPMGAARLRISAFPTAGTGPEATEWVAPDARRTSRYKTTASHCFENDTVDAAGDGIEPASSGDQSIPRFTWWPHQGTREWILYDFGEKKKVSSASVYWFDDTGSGRCRVPASWKLLYRAGDAWRPVEATGAYGTAKDAANKVSFAPVETDALRVEVELQPGFSGGILEWKVE